VDGATISVVVALVVAGVVAADAGAVVTVVAVAEAAATSSPALAGTAEYQDTREWTVSQSRSMRHG
jgi:hypothetical protein